MFLLICCRAWSRPQFSRLAKTEVPQITHYISRIKKRASTCQQVWGDFRSKMYWVRGEGSSSYLSKGSLSMTMGSQSTQENLTTGWAVRGGWKGGKGYQFSHIYGKQINSLKNIHKRVFHHPVSLKTQYSFEENKIQAPITKYKLNISLIEKKPLFPPREKHD